MVDEPAVSHLFSFCGIIAPIESLEPCPDERLSVWWSLRNSFSHAMVEHAQKCNVELANQRYFYPGFTLSALRLIELLKQLGSAWTDACRAATSSANIASSPLLVMEDNRAFKFSWSYCDVASATVAVTGALCRVTLTPTSEQASYSLYVESIALRYVHVVLLLQLSVYFSAKQELSRAARHIGEAVTIAQRCLSSVRLHANAEKSSPSLYHTPPFAHVDCWNKWLAALLMSQARYTQSEGTPSSIAASAAYDSEHLLKIAVEALPETLMDNSHRAEVVRNAQRCKSHLILQMGGGLAKYALSASDAQSMRIAASILYWFANPGDDTYRELRNAMSAAYVELTGIGVLSTLLFNHDTPIDVVRYDEKKTSAEYVDRVLYLPMATWHHQQMLDEKTAN